MALAVNQGCLGGPETRIRARKGSEFAEISAIHRVALPEARRRLSLEIDFTGPRCGAISALAVDQGCLDGPNTNPREERVGICRDVRDSRVIMLNRRGDRHSKSDYRVFAAE